MWSMQFRHRRSQLLYVYPKHRSAHCLSEAPACSIRSEISGASSVSPLPRRRICAGGCSCTGAGAAAVFFLAGGTAFLLLGRLAEVPAPCCPGLLRPLPGPGSSPWWSCFSVWSSTGTTGCGTTGACRETIWVGCPRFFLLWVGLAWAAGRVYCKALSCLERVAPQGPGVEGPPGS